MKAQTIRLGVLLLGIGLLLLVALGAAEPTSAQASSSKLTVNVKTKFGAKGDGTTDDTAAFQAALASLNAAGGGILVVPTGTYRIQPSVLNIKSHIEVMGHQAVLKANAVGFSLLYLNGAHIGLSGITLEGNYQAIRGLTIVSGSSEVSLRNDVIQDFTQPTDPANTLFYEAPTGIRIEGNGDGITINSTAIRNVIAINTNGPGWPHKVARGIWIAPLSGQTTSKNITIKNSSFYEIAPKDDGDCIVIQDSTAPANLVVENNTFDRCHKRAIKIQVPGAVVRNNHINNPFLGNNSFDTYGPFPFDMYSAISVYASNVAVSGNTIAGVGSFYAAIDLGAVNCVELKTIAIRNNAVQMGAGANLTGASLVRSFVPMNGLVIMGNQLDYAQNGIILQPNVLNAKIAGNTFGAHVTIPFQHYGASC